LASCLKSCKCVNSRSPGVYIDNVYVKLPMAILGKSYKVEYSRYVYRFEGCKIFVRRVVFVLLIYACLLVTSHFAIRRHERE